MANEKGSADSVDRVPLPSRVRLKIRLGSSDEAMRRLIGVMGSFLVTTSHEDLDIYGAGHLVTATFVQRFSHSQFSPEILFLL